ncbi:MAG: Tricarboxylate transport protein TctC, partial [uncultured Acetobacteraceae bacterium]
GSFAPRPARARRRRTRRRRTGAGFPVPRRDHHSRRRRGGSDGHHHPHPRRQHGAPPRPARGGGGDRARQRRHAAPHPDAPGRPHAHGDERGHGGERHPVPPPALRDPRQLRAARPGVRRRHDADRPARLPRGRPRRVHGGAEARGGQAQPRHRRPLLRRQPLRPLGARRGGRAGDDRGVPRHGAGHRRADGRAHRPALRPGDQHRALHPRRARGGLRRQQPAAPARPPAVADHGRSRLPGHRHERLARAVRAGGHAGAGAGGDLRRAAQRVAGGAPARPLRRPADRAGVGRARHPRLPPPLPGRRGRALAAGHPGGRGLRGL